MLFRQSIAYAGPYPLVNDAVIHHVPVAADPTWTGVDQMRYLQFEVERLIIATPVFVLAWRKSRIDGSRISRPGAAVAIAVATATIGTPQLLHTAGADMSSRVPAHHRVSGPRELHRRQPGHGGIKARETAVTPTPLPWHDHALRRLRCL